MHGSIASGATRRRLLGLALPALLLPGAALADKLSLPGSGVRFEAPEGFTPLSTEEIAAKYPRSQPPRYVVGNARRTTTIAYDLKPNRLPADKLAEVQAAFEKTFERMIAGLVWKERKLVTQAGRQWIYLEMTSNAVDTDIHNIMLVTPHKDGMLLFNFNSTKEEFPKMEQALRRSVQTIALD